MRANHSGCATGSSYVRLDRYGVGMISFLNTRRSGKTTRLLKQAAREREAVIISPTRDMSSVCFEYALEFFGEAVNKKVLTARIIYLKTGCKLYFRSFDRMQQEPGLENTPKFIDELPLLLDRLLNNVKMFTGTTLRLSEEIEGK